MALQDLTMMPLSRLGLPFELGDCPIWEILD